MTNGKRVRIAETTMGPIEYRLDGEGPTIMVLNGGHCSRDTRLSHERLAEHGLSVLPPSRPGYDSTPAEVGKSAQEATDALAELLDTLQIANADVLSAFRPRGPRPLLLRSVMRTEHADLSWSLQ
jgi:hypothetical protein